MVSRHEDGVHLDVFDQLELEQVYEAIPGNPIDPLEAVKMAYGWRRRSESITEAAQMRYDSASRDSREKLQQAHHEAVGLMAMHNKVLEICPDEDKLYLSEQKKTTE